MYAHGGGVAFIYIYIKMYEYKYVYIYTLYTNIQGGPRKKGGIAGTLLLLLQWLRAVQRDTYVSIDFPVPVDLNSALTSEQKQMVANRPLYIHVYVERDIYV